MKRISITLLILLLLSLTSQTQPPYRIKSARIDYIFNNGFQSGTKTLIFTDSGRTEKVYGITQIDTSLLNTIPEEFSQTQPSSGKLVIQTPDSIISIDLKKGIANKRPRSDIDLSSFLDSHLKPIGTETFLNRMCEVMDVGGFKIWYWKGLALKKELMIDGNQKVYEYAVSIDENYVIKPDEFKVPENVTFQ